MSLRHVGSENAGSWVISSMKGFTERAIGNGEHEIDEKQHENENEAHPREGNHRSENAAGLELVTPIQIAPVRLQAEKAQPSRLEKKIELRSTREEAYRCDGSTNEPHNE